MEIGTDPRTSSYAPRNLLNADQLKAGIAQRSQGRGDEGPVQSWLLNHFYRHLVGNFEPARTIFSLEEAASALGSDTLPIWVAGHFKAAAKALNEENPNAVAPLVWIDPLEPQLLHQEAVLVEFLTSRKGTALEGKLDRITCPQALALWEKEHAQMAARVEQGWRQSSADALDLTLACADHNWVELRPQSPLLRAEMAFESYVMRHCLGQFANRRALTGGYGERYAEAVEQQSMRVFSLRDAQGQPHITVSLIIQDDGALTVEQVKGKQNRPPIERYFQDLLRFLNTLDTDLQTPADCIAIGIVRTEAGWLRIEEVSDAQTQTRLVARYPQLFCRLDAPSAMVEWLVAARQSDLLLEVAPQAPSVKYATRHIFKKSPWPQPHADAPSYRTEGVTWTDMSPLQAEEIAAWQARNR
ncbi:hypothetical protein SAMN05216178_1492 [Pseudomonas saponiphila]|uniref:Uncharacterized protein n=1 Tax=Pseudomonas saponiphila TaxID=556534 RepID=A0A1H4KQU9_9PSED|nr:hypothetical protein [Pseudomonas saponiphila]SEB60877.1 hypothetical protein SAMN05216178_1492 [Pseudomonas saponiphila]